MRRVTVFLAVLSLALAIPVEGKRSCAENGSRDDWKKFKEKRIKEGTKAYISGDILSSLEDAGATDNGHSFTLGGKGSETLGWIELGASSKGLCWNGDDCMKACQALCCMAEGCDFANLKVEEDEVSMTGLVESSKVFSCKIWKSRSNTNTNDSWDFCELTGDRTQTCPSLIEWFEGLID